MRRLRAAAGLLALVLALAAGAAPSAAHPHVWVTVETTVVYEDGRITGLRHRWVFDELYAAMAIQGLDADGDGTYTREELAELAQVNIDGLKEFKYFTFSRLGDKPLTHKDPIDYYLEYKNDELALYFTLPLEEPVLAEAQGFKFSVFDETFFIAFDFREKEPVKLSAGAPEGCSVDVGVPENELVELKALNEAFGGSLTEGDNNVGMGMGYARTVTLGCKKS